MNAYKDFIISPIGERYDNVKQFDDKELILNTEISNHQFVNRKAKVIATPLLFQSPVKVGDEVVVHHNVFRRWHNIKGVEKNSRSYFEEDKYLVSEDQIYLYNNKAMPGYTLVKPIESNNQFSLDKEQELITEELKNSGKPEDIAKKISLGKMNKFKEENALLTQAWVMEPKKKVQDVLKDLAIKDLKIKEFSRIKIGE